MMQGTSSWLLSQAMRTAFGVTGWVAGPRLSILIFHRVLAEPDALLPDEVHAARFDQLMQLVSRTFHVLTLGDAIAQLARGRLVRRALVVTFDDGYADNAGVALPILQRHGLVATFFVSTGFLNGGRMWNDTVIEALRRTALDRVELPELGIDELSLGSVEQRRAAMGTLLPKLKYRQPAEREEAVARLVVRLGSPTLPNDLMMTGAQVRQLRESGMEIGAHTVNHPILASLPPEQAWREIVDGRDQLAAVAGAPINVMAYPNGVPHRDFGAEHVEMLRRAGFQGAVTTAPGVARVGDDPFQLPRFSPWDRSLWRWSARLLLNQRQTGFSTVGPAGAAAKAGARAAATESSRLSSP